MTSQVYIDGHVGTTGLRIRDWLEGREDFELLTLPESKRKDASARREMLESADIAVLCLPDDAAREASEWATQGGTRLLDASSAHRISKSWVYGLPELQPDQRAAITSARLVSNPGCYPTGVIFLLRPLIDAGLLGRDAPISVHALSGYTGGGRPLIEKWEAPSDALRSLPFEAPYALDRIHKHVPEMKEYSGLSHMPQFVPAVGPFRCGMRVEIFLHAGILPEGSNGKHLFEALDERYRGERFVHVIPIAEPLDSHERSFDPRACNDTNEIALRVLPHPSGHVLLIAILDNLGKGAAGNAIQCLNLMLGSDEDASLRR